MTWGDPESGGGSSGVQDQLRNVQRIYATASAFAALLADGTVVTWGAEEHGTVAAWGSPELVGDAAVLQLPEQLTVSRFMPHGMFGYDPW